jgi:molecular chaperone DnaJ
MRDFYAILGIPQNAGGDEIRRAYRRLARDHHPDRSGDTTAIRFREIRQAYEILSDAGRRRAYDAQRAAGRRLDLPAGGDWFADEIAVDFPSLLGLVDRIRDGFLGQDEEVPVSAEIRLSRSEAYCGVRVPLDVPVRATCRACGGRGEIWPEPCHRCGGTGEARFFHPVHLTVPAGVRDGARFRFSVTSPHTPPTFVEIRIAVR